MSINFSTFKAVPYKGGIVGYPITFAPGKQQKLVTLNFDWKNTYTGQAVNINLQSNAVTQPLTNIAMLYVDNSGNWQNIAVYFPDTQYSINVPAYSSGYYPVFTNGLLCTVYNGTTGGSALTTSVTTILFCDFIVPGFLSLEGVASLGGGNVQVLGNNEQTLDGTTGNKGAIVPSGNYLITSVTMFSICITAVTTDQIVNFQDITLKCGSLEIISVAASAIAQTGNSTDVPINQFCGNQTFNPPLLCPFGNSINLWVNDANNQGNLQLNTNIWGYSV